VQINEPAPNIVVNDYEGNKFDLSKCKNKYVLINFWSTNCSQYDLQFIYKLRQQLHNDQLVIIGITNDKKEDIEIFNNKNKLNYTITHSCSKIFDIYEVSKTPSYFLINKNGLVIKKRFHIERLSEEIMEIISSK